MRYVCIYSLRAALDGINDARFTRPRRAVIISYPATPLHAVVIRFPKAECSCRQVGPYRCVRAVFRRQLYGAWSLGNHSRRCRPSARGLAVAVALAVAMAVAVALALALMCGQLHAETLQKPSVAKRCFDGRTQVQQ